MINKLKNKLLSKAFVIVFAFSSFSLPQTEEEIFRKGNEFYRQKQFDKAIQEYTQLVNSGYEGTSLFYNLGNAFYRQGEIGYAILYYEKALKHSPGDEDIQHNLTLANLKTIDKLESLPKFFLFEWWEGLLVLFSNSGWIIVTYVFYLVLIFSIGFYFFVKNSLQQKIVLMSGVISTVLLILCITLSVVKVNKESVEEGIIIDDIVNVKLSPDSGSNDAFIIHEGLKVKFEDEVDDWVKIRLEDGKVGWIQESDAKVI